MRWKGRGREVERGFFASVEGFPSVRLVWRLACSVRRLLLAVAGGAGGGKERASCGRAGAR